MKSLLIDTNIYCDAMRGRESAVSAVRRAESVLMSPIVIGELLFGFKNGKNTRDNIKQLDRFLLEPRVTPLNVTADTADFYSLILQELRKQGTPIPTNDIWIAASALEHGAYLATQDRHFQQIGGLLLLDLD